jgi:hypothetical protein
MSPLYHGPVLIKGQRFNSLEPSHRSGQMSVGPGMILLVSGFSHHRVVREICGARVEARRP